MKTDVLREAVTVLDEPFHREAVAAEILRAADALDAQAREIERLRDKLGDVWTNGYAHGHQDALRNMWRPKEARNLYGAALALREAATPSTPEETSTNE